MRERSVASNAASEQSKGLRILELGAREIELAGLNIWGEAEIVAASEAAVERAVAGNQRAQVEAQAAVTCAEEAAATVGCAA